MDSMDSMYLVWCPIKKIGKKKIKINLPVIEEE